MAHWPRDAEAESFDAIDANHDGGLSEKEIEAFAADMEKKLREFSVFPDSRSGNSVILQRSSHVAAGEPG